MTAIHMLIVSSDTYPPTRVDVAELFGVKLVERGHRIDWILQSEAACPRAYVAQWHGGKVWVGATDLGDSLPRRLRKHLLGIINDLRVIPCLWRTRYDLVQVKDKFIAGAITAVASRIFKTRYVYWLSYPFPEHYLLRAADGTARYPWLYRIRGIVFKRLLYHWLLRAADHVFVQSEQMREDLAQQGIAKEKMTAVPMGVSAQTLIATPAPAVRRLLPMGIPCIVYLGTLVQVRRLDFLVRAFAMVSCEMPAARLYFVGKGDAPSDEEFLKSEVARCGLEAAVTFAGQLPRNDALAYVVEADVCVSPFYPTPVLSSASPTKLVEYMALRKAVVVNDHPEQRRIIEESGAGYCVPWEERAFADAMVALLRNPLLAAEMGERGRKYVLQHRSYDVISQTVEGQLLKLVGA